LVEFVEDLNGVVQVGAGDVELAGGVNRPGFGLREARPVETDSLTTSG